MLQLKLFGGFHLSDDDGSTINVAAAKQRALLSYLAINSGRNFERSQLAGLLWGGLDEARARHSLTQALSSIAAALGAYAERLERSRTSVCLASDCIDVDLKRLLAVPSGDGLDPLRLAEAVEVWEPGLFSELSLSEPAFDEWALMTREEYEQLALRAGTTYLSLDEESRAGLESLAVARKMLRIDPFYEPAHRAVIREHLKQGDVAAASKQADACQTVLRDELGVEPGPETMQLIVSIRAPHAVTTRLQERVAEAEEGRPSIVIPAIQNLAGDPGVEHICQGLSDDITTELARHRSLFVISRESAFQISCHPENAGNLCRRLGVRHVLCGSLRPHRNKFRVNLRLIDGASSRTVWSERYDVDREELIDVSDEVTEHLVARLSASLEEDALVRTRRKPPANWTAYDHLLQGLVHHHKSWFATGTLLGAVKHFKRAVDLDPNFARAHAYLACSLSAPWYKDREPGRLDRCLIHAQQAVALDPFEAEAQRIMGGVHLTRGNHELSDHHFRQALRAHPGNAHVLAHAARYHAHVGENGSAISLVNRARQLNPLHPAWYWQHLGIARFGQGAYREAVQMFSRLQSPVFYDRLYLAAANAHLGEKASAQRHLNIALQEKPSLDLEKLNRLLPYSRLEDRALVVEGLRVAGLR